MTTTATRQQIHIAMNALLDAIESEGCHHSTISIESGFNMGHNITRTVARVYTSRVGDPSREPQEVLIKSWVNSDETTATITVEG